MQRRVYNLKWFKNSWFDLSYFLITLLPLIFNKMKEKSSSFIKDENQSWFSFTIELIILIAIILVIRFWVFQFFQVSGPSMCPTLNMFDGECSQGKGEFIFVNEFLYNFIREPKRGEIVVFKPPVHRKGKDYYIKRIIGVPGDTVEVIKI
jgi:signal peptidase I